MKILGSGEVRRRPDLSAAIVAILMAVGGVAISSSARVFEDAVSGHAASSLLRSLLYLVVGLGTLFIVALPDYRKVQQPALLWLLLAGTAVTLLLPLFGPEINNTHRWLRLGPLSLQPSEFAKPVLIVLLAASLARTGERVRRWEGLVRPLLITGVIGGLVLAGGDLGTPTLMFATALAMIFAAGGRLMHFIVLSSAGTAVFTLAVNAAAYRRARLAAYVDGLLVSPENLGHLSGQLRQSIIAVGSGGIFGKGFGASTQKAFFLPEPDNDFIYAIIGEELGLVGAMAVLVAFLVIAWRGTQTSAHASDELGRLIAIGATVLIVGQALCHIGIVLGMLPTKGLPLPFLSSGGSSLVSSFALIGLLLGVSQRRRVHA
ncbi:MAG: FtsW/RodA/SpoVE family cell cycle protein [Acidobacteriota bacterium]|nr:FtsW/RodA/SpoVE family cell cycle protein [Acidobacteriota bacterium]MDQ7087924.1 FtsW/RodA/SpoVE family cell cycle protein [Acidobacteriota bacterium]